MLEYLMSENVSDVGDDKDNIFGLDSATFILYFFPEEVETIVAIFIAGLLPPHQGIKESFILIRVEVFNRIDCEVSDELNSCLRIYVYLFLNIDVDLVQSFDADELRNAHNYFVNQGCF